MTGVPTEYTSPPIRDGVPHIPKPISHEPPVRTGTSSPFSLTTTKNDDRKATQRNFDNKSSKLLFGLAAPFSIFSNGHLPPTLGKFPRTRHRQNPPGNQIWRDHGSAQLFPPGPQSHETNGKSRLSPNKNRGKKFESRDLNPGRAVAFGNF